MSNTGCLPSWKLDIERPAVEGPPDGCWRTFEPGPTVYVDFAATDAHGKVTTLHMTARPENVWLGGIPIQADPVPAPSCYPH